MQLKSKDLTLNFNKTTFGVESILINDDATFFEWCGGGNFGLAGCNNFMYKSDYGEVFKGWFQYFGNLQAEVTASPSDIGVKFEYCFKNCGKSSEELPEGYLGVYLPFNNGVDIPEVTLARRANTHIRIGGGAYIYNARVSGGYPAVGVAVTAGEVTCYAEERGFNRKKRSTPFLCLPAMTLQPNEEYCFSFELFVYNSKEEFFAKLKDAGILQVTCDNYFPADGGVVTVSADAERLTLDGAEYEFADGKCSFEVSGKGEKDICVYSGSANAKLKIFVQDEDAYSKRAEFVCKVQQIKSGAAKGAFTAYDNEADKQVIRGGKRSAFNLAGFRAAPLLALLSGVNSGKLSRETFAESITSAVEFYDKNVYCGGDVADDVSQKTVRVAKRYCSYPLYAAIKAELYLYGGRTEDLMQAAAIMLTYYRRGNHCGVTPAVKIIELLEKAGKNAVAAELSEQVKLAADAAIKAGGNYPELHGMPYCMQAVSGVASAILDGYKVTSDKCYLDAVKEHIDRLSSFCFEAADYRLNGVPLVFEKDLGSGFISDKSPHFTSAWCAVAFAKYAELSGEKRYFEMAKNIFNACLSLFDEGRGARSLNAAHYLNAEPFSAREKISGGEDIIFYYINLIFEGK